MDIEILKSFFFWCMIINFGIYLFAVVAVIAFRDFICKMHTKWFDIDNQTAKHSLYKYLAAYKLLVTIFNFTPWIALVIIT